MLPTYEDFVNELNSRFISATQQGLDHLIVISGDLHTHVGGYTGHDHRMPICCDVMMNTMNQDDEIIYQPPKGKGAKFEIKYVIPRA